MSRRTATALGAWLGAITGLLLVIGYDTSSASSVLTGNGSHFSVGSMLWIGAIGGGIGAAIGRRILADPERRRGETTAAPPAGTDPQA